jgi:hypothetical protein
MEMNLLRRKEGCTLSGHKWNEEILEKLKVDPVDVNLKKKYKSNYYVI